MSLTANRPPDTTCLGIAIDHRLRALFRPVAEHLDAPDGTHLDVLAAHGRHLGRPADEISVTTALAGPRSTGGVAVVLQQPRANHPFHRGVDAVIDDCDSLAGLGEVLRAVSRGSLDIRSNVTVVDLLPFVSDKPAQLSKLEIHEAFEAAAHAIAGKEPDVVLCAGKAWLGDDGKASAVQKGQACKLESAGVGKTFQHKEVRLFSAHRDHVRVKRVNGFHPSHALNYDAEESCLRQLQLLTAAEACGVARGDWVEEGWMAGLRARCATTVEHVRAARSPGSPPSPSSPGRNAGRNPGRARYLPDYADLYAAKLKTFQAKSKAVTAPRSADSPDLYDALVGSSLTETCNDLSLILRQMARLQRQGWPAAFDAWNTDKLRAAARATWLTLKVPYIGPGRLNGEGDDERLALVLRRSVVAIKRCVANEKDRPWTMDLDEAADGFLKLAEDSEVLMYDLLREEEALQQDLLEEVVQEAERQEDLLAQTLGRMSLAGRPWAPVGPAVRMPPRVSAVRA